MKAPRAARFVVLGPIVLALVVLTLFQGRATAAEPDGGVAARVSPPEAVREIFATKSYTFCHENDYPLTAKEKEWCDLGSAAAKPACPTLPEVCRNQASARQLELRESTFSFTWPELGRPARALLWALLGLGLALLVFMLVRQLSGRSPGADVVAAPVPAQDEAAAAGLRQVETDVQRLLERAQGAAARGDFQRAVGDAYAALLRRLEGGGLLRVAPDQTNGDYLRKIKTERPGLGGRMADVVEEVEVSQFADVAPSRERFDRVWRGVTSLLAEPLGPLLVLVWMLAIGGCVQPRADWEHSPSGRAAVIAYLGKRGFDVHERLVSVAKIGDSQADQLVVLPGAHLGGEAWSAVERWVRQGRHSLVVAGGEGLPGWLGGRVREGAASTQHDPIVATPAAGGHWRGLVLRVPGGSYVQAGQGGEILLVRKGLPYAVERWPGQESIGDAQNESDTPGPRALLLADDLLFRNASLLVADNAVGLEHLLAPGGSRIELAGDLTGLVAANPVQSVQRGRLAPALLQLAVFLALFFVCKGARFGRPVEAAQTRRRELVEHVRALGVHYARAHAERHALACWGGYALERLRERCGRQGDGSLSGLAAAVAARTGREVGQVMRWLVEARDAKAGAPADKGARDLETVLELCKLLQEIGGSGGHKRIQSDV